jgi:peptidoglycan/xylan/chitin deacetylase (PgdA/CDA1 family)
MRFFSMTLFLSLFVVTASAAKPTQFVALAFDGSKNIDMWQKTRDFALENNIKFTYFVSGVYFLTENNKRQYVEPQRGAGASAIGFGGDQRKIQERLNQMVKAVEEGHEMASHANGHFDGSNYSGAQWNSEFSQFTRFLTTAWERNSIRGEPSWWQDLFAKQMYGFRAPLLGDSQGMWGALRNHGFVYDTSRADQMSYWPRQINGLWNFPLAGVKIAGTNRNTLSMDYNFYYAQSKGNPGRPADFARFEEEMYQSYMNYFANNYNGNRAPIHIGHHFSLWNGGAYWRALQRFAKNVCHRPEVKCGTYTELMEMMQTKLPFNEVDHQPTTAQKRADLSAKELAQVRSTLADHWKGHED